MLVHAYKIAGIILALLAMSLFSLVPVLQKSALDRLPKLSFSNAWKSVLILRLEKPAEQRRRAFDQIDAKLSVEPSEYFVGITQRINVQHHLAGRRMPGRSFSQSIARADVAGNADGLCPRCYPPGLARKLRRSQLPRQALRDRCGYRHFDASLLLYPVRQAGPHAECRRIRRHFNATLL